MEKADREVPKPKPVRAGAVRYEVVRNARMRGFEQAGGVVAAVDGKTGAELWALKVYAVAFEPGEERDVQEVYITALKVDADGRHLLVTDERGRVFAVDLQTRKVAEVAPRR